MRKKVTRPSVLRWTCRSGNHFLIRLRVATRHDEVFGWNSMPWSINASLPSYRTRALKCLDKMALYNALRNAFKLSNREAYIDKRVSTRFAPCKPILVAQPGIWRKTRDPPIRWSLRREMIGEFRALNDQIAHTNSEASVSLTIDSIGYLVRCRAYARGAWHLGVDGSITIGLGHWCCRWTNGLTHRRYLGVRRRLLG